MTALASSLRKPFGLSARAGDVALIGLVTAVTLIVEIALVERKYGIFGGGFGQSQALAGIGPIALFGLTVTACHGFIVTLLFLLLRRLHRGARRELLFRINFALLVPALAVAAMAAKYEVLSYFSDAISFQLIRNLGGGSLFDAMLFVLSDGALMVASAMAGIAIYVWILRRYLRATPDQPETGVAGLRVPLRWLAVAFMALAGLIYVADMRGEVRSALGRFSAYALIDGGLDLATDFDRDGYGLFGQPADRWPFDGARYPFALDVPGNGVDEDGIAGDFRLDRAASAGAEAEAIPRLPERPRNLVVIVLESTRADGLGRKVRGQEVMPNTNALAAAGSAFPAAYSHVGFTTASLKSLFSGRLETAAGGPSLFRDLKANGYRIGVFSGQPESFGDISETVGMQASADIFRDAETLKAERAFGFAAKGSLLVDGKVLLREFDRSFGKRSDWKRPVFLYFNLQSAHFPYHHPGMEQRLPGKPIPRAEINQANRDWTAATYWNAVAQADSQVGALVSKLKALGVYDNTLLLITADHGESLFDDGFLGHGHMLNRQQTHIPLVINMPGVAENGPIGLADYRALILRLLGAKGAVAEPAERPVLQYIGTLDRPSYIGLVDARQRWTVLRLQDREVTFSDVAGAYSYDALASRPDLKPRADRLILEWEKARWTNHAWAAQRRGSPAPR